MHPSGEINIEVLGKTLRMRPSYKALSRIEEACDKGISGIVKGFGEGDVRHTHITNIIFYSVMAGEDRGQCPSIDEIGEWLMHGGMGAEILEKSILPYLQEALKAGPKPS